MTLAFTIPSLTTDRLVLRAPQESDFPAMVRFFEGPRAGFLSPADRRMVWVYLMASIGHWALRGYGFYAVDTLEGDFIGRIGVIYNDGWPEPELAWHLFDGFEGMGYGFEAAQAARADYHARISTQPLISMIDPANTRSIALATRLGAQFERAEPGIAKPYHIYRHPAPKALQ